MDKTKVKHLLLFLLITVFLCFGAGTVLAADTTSYEITGKYSQTEARTMLNTINSFRTGSSAWYWNADNTTKTTASGLGKLTYDYNLEQIAMKRAMETAVYWDHVRPNGQSFNTMTVNGTVAYAENLAAGTSLNTAASAFAEWKEDDADYANQGHRRTMLNSSYSAVGIACVYYNGCYYWVQEYGFANSGAAQITAKNDNVSESIEIANANVSSRKISVSVDAISIGYGSSTELPTAELKISTPESWLQRLCPVTTGEYTWTVKNTSYAEISDGKLIAKKCGTTSISTTISGMTVTIPVTITKISLQDADVIFSESRFVYLAMDQRPVPTVRVSGSVVPESEYTLTYKNNQNAGTAQVTVTGKNNAEGKVTKEFTIEKANIFSNVKVTVSSAVYTGAEIKPTIKAVLEDNENYVLKEDVDYTVKVYDNTVAGEKASVVLTGIGNFTGSNSVYFSISKIAMADCTFSTIPTQQYTGASITPAVTVTYGGRTLKEGTDYSITYDNNKKVGVASVIITGIDNYEGTKRIYWDITRADISKCTFSSVDDQVYTGETYTPEITVKNGDLILVKDTDYSITYSSNTNAGTAVITIKGIGNYTGTAYIKFNIKAINISSGKIEGLKDATYTGKAITQSIKVTLGDKTLTASKDYTIVYNNNTNAGYPTVTVKGAGNYSGTITGKFTIWQASLTAGNISNIASCTYTGSAITPVPQVTFNGVALESGKDFDVKYSNNTNAGTATVTITGKRNYTASASKTFEIKKANINNCTIETIADQKYTGNAITPSVTIKNGKNVLTVNKDYTLYYLNNKEIGKAAVTITGIGNYEGTTGTSFTIAANPTPAPTSSPTAAPSPEPTTVPSPEPTAAPDPEPSIEPSPSENEIKNGTIYQDSASKAVYKINISSSGISASYQKPINAKTTSVVIPDTITLSNGKTCRVTSIAAKAFMNNKTLKKVKIGKYVKLIDSNAFRGCDNLKYVTGGEALTTIRGRAFAKCTSLRKFTIPSGVITIGKQAFYGCKNLKAVVIASKKLTSAKTGANAFAGIYKKASIRVPASKAKAYKKLLTAKGAGSAIRIVY